MNTPLPTNPLDFQPFDKMARLTRECIITEKIDGTNAQILVISETERAALVAAGHADAKPFPEPCATVGDLHLYAGSRTRWIRPKQPGEKGDPDNYGFAAWVRDNATELVKLGAGRHFGEWYGRGINTGYGLTERRFALFNTSRWSPYMVAPSMGGVTETLPDGTYNCIACCHVVPIIWQGNFDTRDTDNAIEMLRSHGSFAVPGFMKPEGIVVFHVAAGKLFKKTLENDASPKSVPGLTNPRQLSAGVEAAKASFESTLLREQTV